MTFEAKALTDSAVVVMGQLFVHGPTWDGNLVTKAGRDSLVKAGLAGRIDGWNFLTAEGVQVAAKWKLDGMLCHLKRTWKLKAART